MSEYISQELAKRLQAKGFRAEHGNVWIKNMAGAWSVSMKELNCQPTAIPAYTFTELWAVLPKKITVKDVDKYPSWTYYITAGASTEYVPIKLSISYRNLKGTYIKYHGTHESPAEAAGLMVERLIDNGHMG